MIFDVLEWPYPGFQGHGIIKSRISRRRCESFHCTKHSCRLLGALPKTCKNWGRRWIFLAKSAGRCFTPLIEIKHNNVSLRWNFYAYIQLIRGRIWLQLWTVKKFSEPRVSWKYLAKMWKNSKRACGFAAWMDGQTLLAFSSTACRRPRPRPPAGGKANRLVGLT